MTRFNRLIYSKIKFFIVSAFLFSSVFLLHAENITDQELGFSLDIPEGYDLKDYTDDGLSLFLEHKNLPVSLAIKSYLNCKGENSKSILSSALNKLDATFSADEVEWNSYSCAIAEFNMTLDILYSGWAIAAPVSSENHKNSYTVLICYCPAEIIEGCSMFIMSTLNSYVNDINYYNAPGLIAAYAFPSEGKKQVTLKINNKKINTSIDKADIDGADFLITMEYSVLRMYISSPFLKEAWIRFYRLIYRDSVKRLEQVCNDIYKALWPDAQKMDSNHPDIKYAQLLLDWVQGFNYIRASDVTETDFTPLPAAINGTGNDCDSRSMLIAVLLKNAGIETLFLFSPEYSHAMAAAELDGLGMAYNLSGSNRYFLYGETTAKVTWGMIAQDYADETKWIPVILP